jgi:hypothetical protein
MAAQREASKSMPFTIANAIEEALWMRKTPDGYMTPEKQRLLVLTLLSALESSPCFFKGARLNIPTFTLLSYDLAGHAALQAWINAAEAHGCRPEKVDDARRILRTWSQLPGLRWPT